MAVTKEKTLLPFSSFTVHILVFEEWRKPLSYHGASLRHPQISGGAGQNVQPVVQESLLVQTSSSAPEEGKSAADGSFTLPHTFACIYCSITEGTFLPTLKMHKGVKSRNIGGEEREPFFGLNSKFPSGLFFSLFPFFTFCFKCARGDKQKIVAVVLNVINAYFKRMLSLFWLLAAEYLLSVVHQGAFLHSPAAGQSSQCRRRNEGWCGFAWVRHSMKCGIHLFTNISISVVGTAGLTWKWQGCHMVQTTRFP